MTPAKRVHVERLNGGEPILRAVEAHPWENGVVFNPGCAFLDDAQAIRRLAEALPAPGAVKGEVHRKDAVCVLFYRAQGEETAAADFRRSRLGVAVFDPELRLVWRSDDPCLVPESPYENLGIEDPRVTRLGDEFVMCYVGYSSFPPSTPPPGSTTKVSVCLAVSDDLVTWRKLGPARGTLNDVDNKNAALFPDRPDRSLVMFHRPMQGPDAMTIHLAHATGLGGDWEDVGMIMAPLDDPTFAKSWIGAGAPPIRIGDDRYLFIYHIGHHRHDGSREYDLGAALLTHREEWKVTSRIEPLLVPETTAERLGHAALGVNNVVFLCGAYRYGAHLYLPYAGADSVVLAARLRWSDLLDALTVLESEEKAS